MTAALTKAVREACDKEHEGCRRPCWWPECECGEAAVRLAYLGAERTFDAELDRLAKADQRALREMQARAEGAERMVEILGNELRALKGSLDGK